MVRFVHTSDWQLGMTRHFLDQDAQARYTEGRLQAIRRIGELAERARCDFVVVAGDVFETNGESAQLIRRTFDALRSIPCPVYLLPGNHDPLNAATIYRRPVFLADLPDHVHALTESGRVEVPGLGQRVELVAAPWFSKDPRTDLVGAAVADLPVDGALRIVVGHGAVERVGVDNDTPATIRLAPMEDAIAAGSVHYVALGDRHSTLAVGRTGRIHYSGSPEVTAHRDTAAGNVLLVDLDDSECTVRTERVGRWHFLDLTAELSTSSDLDDLDTRLAALPDKQSTVVLGRLRGTLTLAERTRLDEILGKHRDVLAGLYLHETDTDLAVIVDGTELADLGIGGYVDSAAGELAETLDDEAARDALCLLYRLAGGGAR